MSVKMQRCHDVIVLFLQHAGARILGMNVATPHRTYETVRIDHMKLQGKQWSIVNRLLKVLSHPLTR